MNVNLEVLTARHDRCVGVWNRAYVPCCGLPANLLRFSQHPPREVTAPQFRAQPERAAVTRRLDANPRMEAHPAG